MQVWDHVAQARIVDAGQTWERGAEGGGGAGEVFEEAGTPGLGEHLEMLVMVVQDQHTPAGAALGFGESEAGLGEVGDVRGLGAGSDAGDGLAQRAHDARIDRRGTVGPAATAPTPDSGGLL